MYCTTIQALAASKNVAATILASASSSVRASAGARMPNTVSKARSCEIVVVHHSVVFHPGLVMVVSPLSFVVSRRASDHTDRPSTHGQVGHGGRGGGPPRGGRPPRPAARAPPPPPPPAPP